MQMSLLILGLLFLVGCGIESGQSSPLIKRYEVTIYASDDLIQTRIWEFYGGTVESRRIGEILHTPPEIPPVATEIFTGTATESQEKKYEQYGTYLSIKEVIP